MPRLIGLKKAREKAGFTQVKLAEALGVHEITVLRWEGGKRKPDLATLRRIANILKCSLDEVAEEEGSVNPPEARTA